MNELSFRSFDGEEHWIQLLIDGKNLAELLGDRSTDASFQLSTVADDLPKFPTWEKQAPDTYMLGICGCGEWGCSNTSCRITRNSEMVEMSEFKGYLIPEGIGARFQFRRENFDNVVAEIVLLAKAKYPGTSDR